MRVTNIGQDKNLVEMRIDYEKAETPTKAYYADYSDVYRGRGGISLVFGKLKPGTSELRNKVEIVLSEDAFVRQMWKNSREVYEAAKTEFDRRPLDPIQASDTEVAQAFKASAVLMVGMGEEAVMDFYYIAPSDVHFAFSKKRPEVHLDPVIRIVLSGSLLFEVLDKCRVVAEQSPDFSRIMAEE
jgi:hypothetical protein